MAKTNTKTTNEATVEAPAFDGAAFIKECGGVSKAIRKLHEEGKERGEIAKMLDKRYQHVRNVLLQPLKKSANADA